MTQSATQDDLSYIRHLSESGARAPLIGGRFMAWWGLLVTIGWTAQHFAVNGMIGDGNLVFGIIWGSFGLVGGMGQFLLARSMPPMAGAGSAGNLASRVVWGAGACAIVSMFVGVAILAQSASYQVFDWIVPVAFAVYAVALLVTGTLAGERIATVAGYGAVAMVGVYTAFVLHPDRYLIAAAGGAVTVLLPGVLLMLREPKAQDSIAMGKASPFDHNAIDDVIHGRIRLGIVAYLSAVDGALFSELRDKVGATDGNLSAHLRKLEDAGYVAIAKSFVNRKPQTCLSLTKAGRSAWAAWLTQMETLREASGN